MNNTEKAALYDQLLREHGRKATQVRALEVDIQPAPDQQEKITQLRKEMVDLEKRATDLAQEAFR
jgi:cell division protein FtsB